MSTIGESSSLCKAGSPWSAALLALSWGLVSMACSAPQDADSASQDTEEAPALAAVEYEELSRFGRGEDARDPRELFYGPLQARVEEAQERWLPQLRACLQRGPAAELREIIFDVARGSAEEPFGVRDLRVSWGEEYEVGCAREVAEGFAQAVGSNPYDGYDHYVISWVMRPEAGIYCEEEALVCAPLWGGEIPGEVNESPTAECPQEVVRSVEGRLRSLAQRCFAPRNLREQPNWDDPHTGRALVVSELWIVNGAGFVQISSPTPWLEEVAACIATGVMEATEEGGLDAQGLSCRHELRNHGVTFGSLPVFTRVESP